jgi:hypothetical protein
LMTCKCGIFVTIFVILDKRSSNFERRDVEFLILNLEDSVILKKGLKKVILEQRQYFVIMWSQDPRGSLQRSRDITSADLV